MSIKFLPDEIRLGYTNIVRREKENDFSKINVATKFEDFSADIMEEKSCYNKKAINLFQFKDDCFCTNICRVFFAPLLYSILAPIVVGLRKAIIMYNLTLKITHIKKFNILAYIVAFATFSIRALISFSISLTGIYFILMWIGRPLHLHINKNQELDNPVEVETKEDTSLTDVVQDIIGFELIEAALTSLFEFLGLPDALLTFILITLCFV